MGRDILQFVNSISEENINKIFNDYDQGRYQQILNSPHKILLLQQKRNILITYIEYFTSKQDNEDERTIVLTKIVTERNIQQLIYHITNDQFYQEPLYRFIV